jgi:hypothetical protein
MRRIVRDLLITIVTLVAACGLLWLFLAQPVGGVPGSRRSARSVDPSELERRVRALVAVPSRSFGYPESLERAAAFISAEMRAAGARVTEQPFVVQGGTYRNVRAAFGPETAERVVVGAHYDAADENPGADDNASGVAGLLALAELLRDASLLHRAELVAFALEEPPLFGTHAMGSAVHARSLSQAGVRVRGMLSLEMIGYFSDRPGSQTYPLAFLEWVYPREGDFIGVVSHMGGVKLVRSVKRAMKEASSLRVCSLTGPASIPGVAYSDHRSYWAYGYPAAMVTDTASYRNPHYHGVTDLPETLDYRRMADVVRGVFAALIALDGGTPEGGATAGRGRHAEEARG